MATGPDTPTHGRVPQAHQPRNCRQQEAGLAPERVQRHLPRLTRPPGRGTQRRHAQAITLGHALQDALRGQPAGLPLLTRDFPVGPRADGARQPLDK